MTTKDMRMPNAELCRILTAAEVIHRRRQVLALQALRPDEKYAIQDIAGSTTVLSQHVHGRKLNHTYGFGVFGPVTIEHLRAVEQAYSAWGDDNVSGPRPELDVCEYADTSAFDLLSSGYSVTGSICQYQRSIAGFDFPLASVGGIEVLPWPSHEDTAANHAASCGEFVNASIEGFHSGGRSVATLRALAESAVARSDTSLFSATIEGELVGTAVMAVIDVEGCKVANLFMDSCLEHARGKGVHQALLAERIRVAKHLGCDMVMASAREGSGSARNIERAGLRKIFACKTHTKDDDFR